MFKKGEWILKLLQINAVNGVKSTGTITIEIANHLNKKNHEVFIAYSKGKNYDNGFLISNVFEKKIHALLSRLTGKQAYFSKNGTKRLLKYIERMDPDIIHLHNLHSNYINLGLLLNYISENDIPTVITLHDCWFYTGKCTHYTLDECYKWQEQCGNCPRLHKDNNSWFFDFTTQMLKDKENWFNNIPRLAVIGVSDWITNEAKKSILSSAKIIQRIYNWIDMDIFKPVSYDKIERKLELDNKFIILGIASGWSDKKGLEDFISLSKLINKNTRIVLVGKINNKINLPQNIIHIDETDNMDQLAQYYSMADVFLNLSMEESFGKVTAEALACGTPVIVYNSTANPELVGDRCGYVCEPNNIKSVLKSINKIRSKERNYFKNSCIKFARDNFEMSDRINDYINLYKELIGYKGEKSADYN